MADQATNAGGRSSIDPHPETPAAGAAALGDAPVAATTAAATTAATTTATVTNGDPAVDASAEQGAHAGSGGPGFGERGRMRRRLRFLRKARELAYRDLGGLVFEMQRLGERRDELAAAKLATLAAIDTELRALEGALGDRRALTILRESGIAACPRCAAIHGSDDRFCPSCGLAMERRAERPIAVAAPAGPGASVGAAAGATAATAAPPMVPAAPPSAPAAPSAPRTPAASPAGYSPATTQAQPGSSAPTPQAPAPTPKPPAPPAPAPRSTPRPPAPQPAGDDRPTEIIRPADAGSRGDK